MAESNFQNIGRQVDDVATADEGLDQEVVEEIESLCMNCEENVWLVSSPKGVSLMDLTGHNSPFLDKNPLLPRDHHHGV